MQSHAQLAIRVGIFGAQREVSTADYLLQRLRKVHKRAIRRCFDDRQLLSRAREFGHLVPRFSDGHGCQSKNFACRRNSVPIMCPAAALRLWLYER